MVCRCETTCRTSRIFHWVLYINVCACVFCVLSCSHFSISCFIFEEVPRSLHIFELNKFAAIFWSKIVSHLVLNLFETAFN